MDAPLQKVAECIKCDVQVSVKIMPPKSPCRCSEVIASGTAVIQIKYPAST